MSIQSTGRSHWEALLVKPKAAWLMLGCSNSHGYKLLASGEIESFHDGRSRKITVASIHKYIARKVAEDSGKRGRGRPPGSKNKPKSPAMPQPEAAA
jgi:excisionase family DNA binding protein